MAVEKLQAIITSGQGERGQSVIEFLLMLPMLVGLTVIMIRVNTVIQVSIVNQQYARAHTLWLAFDSPVYPSASMRQRFFQNSNKQFNQMIIGVSDNTLPPTGDSQVSATTQNITRAPVSDPGPAGDDISERAMVRVRDTVTLCTQANVISGGQGLVPILPMTGDADPVAAGPNNLSDGTQFAFCSSPLQYP